MKYFAFVGTTPSDGVFRKLFDFSEAQKLLGVGSLENKAYGSFRELLKSLFVNF